MSHFSFQILLSWILSLCPMARLPEILSNQLIFLKKTLMSLLILWIFLCFYLYLNPEFDYFLPSTPLGCICFFLFQRGILQLHDGCVPSCGCWEFHFRTFAHSGPPCSFQLCLLQPKDLFIIISKCSVAVFRHTRRGHQISLRMVVSHHVVAGI